MRFQISEWWDDLTDEDLDRINGDQEQLISALQERYGYTRNLAFVEVKIRMANYLLEGEEKRSGRHFDEKDMEAFKYSIDDADDRLETNHAGASLELVH